MDIYTKIEMLVKKLEHLGESTDILEDYESDPGLTIKELIADVREWLVHIRAISATLNKNVKHGMSHNHVGSIVSRRYWKHI